MNKIIKVLIAFVMLLQCSACSTSTALNDSNTQLGKLYNDVFKEYVDSGDLILVMELDEEATDNATDAYAFYDSDTYDDSKENNDDFVAVIWATRTGNIGIVGCRTDETEMNVQIAESLEIIQSPFYVKKFLLAPDQIEVSFQEWLYAKYPIMFEQENLNVFHDGEKYVAYNYLSQDTDTD